MLICFESMNNLKERQNFETFMWWVKSNLLWHFNDNDAIELSNFESLCIWSLWRWSCIDWWIDWKVSFESKMIEILNVFMIFVIDFTDVCLMKSMILSDWCLNKERMKIYSFVTLIWFFDVVIYCFDESKHVW